MVYKHLMYGCGLKEKRKFIKGNSLKKKALHTFILQTNKIFE